MDKNTFVQLRKRGVPIVAVDCPDQTSFAEQIAEWEADVSVLFGKENPLVVFWDSANGLSAGTEGAKEAVKKAIGEYGDTTIGNPVLAVRTIRQLPTECVLVIKNADIWMVSGTHGEEFVAGIAAQRQLCKSSSRSIWLLGNQIKLPPTLINETVSYDLPLPGRSELRSIVTDMCELLADAEGGEVFKTISESMIESTVDAVTGLSHFVAEQVVSLCLDKTIGIDVDQCWERKRRMIDQTPGLTMMSEEGGFDSIGGCDSIKRLMSAVINGNDPPNCWVFVDEIEKALSGRGDSSGVGGDQLGELLKFMQDTDAQGMIFLGPPGTAKSAVAKGSGAESGKPTMQLDTGGMKGSLVGQSEAQIRNALKTIKSVSGGKSFWIATCNDISSLPPELRRRFTLGTYFFDLPTEGERELIWQIYAKKYNVDVTKRPNDEGWTGAEIRNCCRMAWTLSVSVVDAGQYIVPVAVSSPETVERLRQQADGRYLSASSGGLYRANREDAEPAKKPSKKMHL